MNATHRVYGTTALHEAIKRNHREVIQKLIDMCSVPSNKRTHTHTRTDTHTRTHETNKLNEIANESELAVSIETDHSSVPLLDLNKADAIRGRTPLLYCFHYRNPYALELCCAYAYKRGVELDLSYTDNKGVTAVEVIASSTPRLIRILLANGNPFKMVRVYQE